MVLCNPEIVISKGYSDWDKGLNSRQTMAMESWMDVRRHVYSCWRLMKTER